MHEKNFESQFVSVDIDGKKTILGTIYHTPKQNHKPFLENLKNVLKECNKINKRVFIMGDLNYDLLKTENNDVNNCNDTFFEHGMYPLINVPTRITESTASILDQIWTNVVDIPAKSAVVANPVSDHLPVYLNFGIKKSQDDLFIEKRIFSEKKY